MRTAHVLRNRPSLAAISKDMKVFMEKLANNAAEDLEENLENTKVLKKNLAECRFTKKIFSLMLEINKKLPSTSLSESVFNSSLLHPCLNATVTLAQSSTTLKPYYIPGEETLQAMSQQLKIVHLNLDTRKVYHADGIVRLNDFYDLEILLLETSGCYQNKDERKISFDNIKGIFALLAMMKTVADKFNYASVDTFQKLESYFVQASDEHLRLWSIQYVSNGIYMFNHVDKVVVLEDASQVEQVFAPLTDFFYNVKLCMTDTCAVLERA